MPPLKTYGLTQSPFHKLMGLDDYCALLGLTRQQLKAIRDHKYSLYRPFPKMMNGKPKECQPAVGQLRRIQRRFHDLLSRINTPPYVTSLRRDLTYVENAALHRGRRYVLKTDITGFFENARSKFIATFFTGVLHMNADLAAISAALLSYEGHLPRGGTASQTIAFWAFYPTFERIHQYAQEQGLTFSLWVDDLVFSSERPLPAGLLPMLRYSFGRLELQLKEEKTRKYQADEIKLVTGVALYPDGSMKIGQKTKKKILDTLRQPGKLEVMDSNALMALRSRIATVRVLEDTAFKALDDRLMKRLEDEPVPDKVPTRKHFSSRPKFRYAPAFLAKG
ncbi:MAG TPA: reverse transcriptase family protein [bacterium]|jgi:RNA-directed DNA polymerase|nr:reverse transcriptase family protein [bacterium]